MIVGLGKMIVGVAVGGSSGTGVEVTFGVAVGVGIVLLTEIRVTIDSW